MILFALLTTVTTAPGDDYREARDEMVNLIARRGVEDETILEAMRSFPRHELVPESQRRFAYADRPLPIGEQQTISQPYIVAFMTEAAQVKKGDKVLEIGTGSGYQAAILALVGARVFSIEIIAELAARAQKDLARLGVQVEIRHGDGFRGWPEAAPFDAVIVTAAPERVPEPLLAQLKDGGRLVVPVGPSGDQTLEIHTRRGSEFRVERSFPVRFVPMTGEAERP